MKRLNGKEGEKFALNYLEERGYKILEKNYYRRFGEIDIIAEKDNEIIFFEIRSKGKDDFSPILTINQRKIKKLKILALNYLSEKGIFDKQIRFDIIGLIKNNKGFQVEHIKNAF
ncbi:MAG: YraN family protein [candidate division WOR-3 bacterium]|nr:YraN family protein [candidate division WOR-3 bacterium]MCX7837204.1 YraN family protein [candidate division WOR-3 bacterium]